MTDTEKTQRKHYIKQATEMADSLSALCIRAKIPLFLSMYREDDKKEKKGNKEKNNKEINMIYDNRIVSAALEMPGYAIRINKLILAVHDCGIKLPEHIQGCVDELENWLANEGDYTSEDITVNKFRDFLDIANGQVEATIPADINASDIEEIEVETKKKEE